MLGFETLTFAPIDRHAIAAELLTSDDAAIKAEAVTMSKTMIADNSVDAINKPSAQALAGTPAAK